MKDILLFSCLLAGLSFFGFLKVPCFSYYFSCGHPSSKVCYMWLQCDCSQNFLCNQCTQSKMTFFVALLWDTAAERIQPGNMKETFHRFITMPGITGS